MEKVIQFTPAERMVFYRWDKYEPTKDFGNLFSNPWCPLWGVIPFGKEINPGKPVSAPTFATSLIKTLRTFSGIPWVLTDLCLEAYPNPDVIAQLTGFSPEVILESRRLFEALISKNEVVPSAVVNYGPLFGILKVWDLMKLYFSDPGFREAPAAERLRDIFFDMEAEIDEKGAEWGLQHAENVKALERQRKVQRDFSRNKTVAAVKLEKGERAVKDSFKRLFQNENLRMASLNRIGNSIVEDLTVNDKENSLKINAVKRHLKKLNEKGVIKLPEKS